MFSKKEEKYLKKIGSNIRKHRIAFGYTQQQLSFACDVELSQINRIELGKINTSLLQIKRIAEELEMEVSAIFENI